MKHIQQIEAVQAGLSGPLAIHTREVIKSGNSPISGLEAIATYKELHDIGKTLGETIYKTDSELDSVPIIGMDDAVENTGARIILSNLGFAGASEYEDSLAEGRILTTTGIPNRLTPDSLLTNAYINPDSLHSYFSTHPDKRILATGGGMSSIIALAMEPIDKRIGVKFMDIETLQGRDGEDTDNRPVEISPKYDDDATQIRNELRAFLGKSATDKSPRISSNTKLATWKRGHHAKITFVPDNPASVGEIQAILRSNTAPRWLKRNLDYGEYRPRRHPVKVMPRRRSEELLMWGDDATAVLRNELQPMKIRARVEKLRGGKLQGNLIEVAGDNFMVVPMSMITIGQALREDLI